ncbi:MAG TPA: hypothetical protein VF800_02625 [Telluria sp.]|jgi:hypothetical protein
MGLPQGESQYHSRVAPAINKCAVMMRDEGSGVTREKSTPDKEHQPSGWKAAGTGPASGRAMA